MKDAINIVNKATLFSKVAKIGLKEAFSKTNLIITGAIIAFDLDIIWSKWYKTPRNNP